MHLLNRGCVEFKCIIGGYEGCACYYHMPTRVSPYSFLYYTEGPWTLQLWLADAVKLNDSLSCWSVRLSPIALIRVPAYLR